MPEGYPWYTAVFDQSFEQGDFLFRCPVLHTPQNFNLEIQVPQDVGIREQNVIVLSQSCDLADTKAPPEHITTCQLYFENEIDWNRDKWNSCRKGRLPRHHVLNRSDLQNLETRFAVVDFARIYSIPWNLAVEYAERRRPRPRLRLLPPYREHLAQAFARYFMRVGLPVDIPEF